ncbi:hypothetical protein M758_1G297500 [Ceratodon purpureus]|nr:hypothetical protein M758_1G297500 [Ceratodon purpureus]KAG0632005.1 hypothetical protein M758_1G297500 [Ceratodon purpureus]
MASTGISSRAGICGLAILAILLSPQIAGAWADGGDDRNSGPNCSNSVCQNQNSYAPKHFILVHGMGGGAWFWFEIITLLEHYGFTATAVDLTSHGINKAIADDVTTVAQYAKPLTDAIENATGQVILVGHSLGGGLIAYASELYPTKVSKAIYLSAVTPSYNQSMFGAFPADTFPNLITPGYLTLNFRRGTSTPSSATVNVNALDKFYMSETPKRVIQSFIPAYPEPTGIAYVHLQKPKVIQISP